MIAIVSSLEVVSKDLEWTMKPLGIQEAKGPFATFRITPYYTNLNTKAFVTLVEYSDDTETAAYLTSLAEFSGKNSILDAREFCKKYVEEQVSKVLAFLRC